MLWLYGIAGGPIACDGRREEGGGDSTPIEAAVAVRGALGARGGEIISGAGGIVGVGAAVIRLNNWEQIKGGENRYCQNIP